MIKVLWAVLMGICFSLGLVLLFDGGVWQQPVGFGLVGLAWTELMYVLYNVAEALGLLLRRG